MKKTLLTFVACFPAIHVLPQPAEPRTSVAVHSIEGYGEHEAFARAAAERLEQVINSPLFQELVAQGGYGKRRGLEPKEILQRILNAHEVLGPGGTDGVVDLRLRTMNESDGARWMRNCEPGSRAGTIGKDGGASGVMVTCPYRLELWEKTNSVASLTGHMMHEYMHQLGFSHKGLWKRRSAVYRIAAIAAIVATGFDPPESGATNPGGGRR
jgi:hypothetical protein